MSPERRSHRVEAAKTQLARAAQASQSAGVLAVEKQAAAILLGQVSRSFEAPLASLEDSAGTAEHDERVVRFRRGRYHSPRAALRRTQPHPRQWSCQSLGASRENQHRK